MIDAFPWKRYTFISNNNPHYFFIALNVINFFPLVFRSLRGIIVFGGNFYIRLFSLKVSGKFVTCLSYKGRDEDRFVSVTQTIITSHYLHFFNTLLTNLPHYYLCHSADKTVRALRASYAGNWHIYNQYIIFIWPQQTHIPTLLLQLI